MISHDEALSLSEAYFANRLSREAVREYHAHINDCEDCRVRLRAMKAAAPRAPFTLRSGPENEARREELLRRNRVIMYAVLAVLICFFFMFRLKRG